jgi:hypothetical protein
MERANIILCFENQLSPRNVGLSPFNHLTRLTTRQSVNEFSRCERIRLQTLRLITQTQIYEDEHKQHKTRDSSATPLWLLSTEETELKEYSEFCKEHQKHLQNVEYFNYLDSIISNDARCTHKIKSRIVMSKRTFNKKKQLFISKLD